MGLKTSAANLDRRAAPMQAGPGRLGICLPARVRDLCVEADLIDGLRQ